MQMEIEQNPVTDQGKFSAQYQQISNFCINYLEGLLISLIHIHIDQDLEADYDSYSELQQRLQKRERSIIHAFQLQIEQSFKSFRLTGRARPHTSNTGDMQKLWLAGDSSSRIQAAIDGISEKHQKRHEALLLTLDKYLKTLVQQHDAELADNPISPASICDAFLACIETLNLNSSKTIHLFELFDRVLQRHLQQFYVQIELGIHDLDLLPELGDPATFIQQLEAKKAEEEAEQLEILSITAELRRINDLVDKELQKLREATASGNPDYVDMLSEFASSVSPYIDEEQMIDIADFTQFYIELMNNKLLSNELSLQLSRLCYPLIKLLLLDPLFIRASDHPLNQFLLSIVDFEVTYKHKANSLKILGSVIDKILTFNEPVMENVLPSIQRYENYKAEFKVAQDIINQKKQQQDEQLKQQILETINDITATTVIENESLAFFYDDWQLLLLQVARKLGVESGAYKLSVDIARMLAWALDSEKTEDKPEYREHSFSSVLKAVDQGLRSLNYSSAHRTRVRKQLVKEFKQNNRKPAASRTEHRSADNGLAMFTNMFAGKSNNLTDIQNRNQPQQGERVSFSNQLNSGDWVEIRDAKSKKFNRVKVKWKSADSSMFILLDQRGHQIKDWDAQAIDQAYHNGDIKLISSSKPSTSKRSSLGDGFGY
ncbi:MAG: DUF1631 family protein [Gammaproteobacteria bacterium]|nr:DUF1631 family protein [Gammaproteobacteria bacterium]